MPARSAFGHSSFARAGVIKNIVVFKSVAALFLLNAALSSTNWWPTPFLELDARIAPEFILLWVFLLLLAKCKPAVGGWGLFAITLTYLLFVLGRYFDTTAPALFGRNINIYWDGIQIPRLLWIGAASKPWWQVLAVVVVAIGFFAALWLTLKTCIRYCLTVVAPYALERWWAMGLTGFCLISILANYAGVQATWPYVSRPVIPTYWAQFQLLLTSLDPQKLDKAIPASPVFKTNFGELKGADLNVFFFESYGAIAFDNPSTFQYLQAARQQLSDQVKRNGLTVVSAKLISPTFGGGSDLAHAALVSGVDTTSPSIHDLLITSTRQTLPGHAKKFGYEVYGVYPGLRWDWPESRFYQYDHLIDGRALKYAGPKLGYWQIPDQFSISQFHRLYPLTPSTKPRMLFFYSATSHIPFSPVPPFQGNEDRLLSTTPFEPTDLSRAVNEDVVWTNMASSYARMMEYNFQWFTFYLQKINSRRGLHIVLGDHQPASNVSGQNAPWTVPVHVVSDDPVLINRFKSMGFVDGLAPSNTIGTMSEFTQQLMNAVNQQP